MSRTLSIINNHGFFYPTTNSLSYFWGFGFLALIFLVVQLITGIFLAMHYDPNAFYAFDSITRIMEQVPYG